MIWQDPDSRLTFCLRAKNRNVTKHTWVSTASGTFGISLFPQKLVHTFIILLNGLDLVLLEELQKWHWQNLSHVLQIISVRAQPNTTAFHVKRNDDIWLRLLLFQMKAKIQELKNKEKVVKFFCYQHFPPSTFWALEFAGKSTCGLDS